jgi:hypothetical protein
VEFWTQLHKNFICICNCSQLRFGLKAVFDIECSWWELFRKNKAHVSEF